MNRNFGGDTGYDKNIVFALPDNHEYGDYLILVEAALSPVPPAECDPDDVCIDDYCEPYKNNRECFPCIPGDGVFCL